MDLAQARKMSFTGLIAMKVFVKKYEENFMNEEENFYERGQSCLWNMRKLFVPAAEADV